MKTKILFIALIVLITASCKKDDEQLPATVNIEVSYFYNTYQGYKPDVAAIAYLCEKDKTAAFYNDSTAAIALRIGLYTDIKGDWVDIPFKYKGEAGTTGTINIQNVDPGKYLLLLASKGRYTYSHKYITIKSADNISLVKNFNYYDDYSYGGELW